MASYGGSEEYLAGLGRSQAAPDQSQYLNQINRGTDTTVGLLQNAGNQLAENNRAYWQNLQHGVESGLNQYNRAQDKATEQKQWQAEEARANAKMGIDQQRADNENKAFELQDKIANQDYALQNEVVGPNGETVAKMKAIMPMKQFELDQKRADNEAAETKSRLDTESQTRKLTALQIGQTGDQIATDKAALSLHSAVMAGDKDKTAAIVQDLRSQGVPENIIQAAAQKKNAERTQAYQNGEDHLLIDPNYRRATQVAEQTRQDAGSLMRMQSLIDTFKNQKNKGGPLGLPLGLNSEAAKDALDQMSALATQSGYPEIGAKIKSGTFNYENIDQMELLTKMFEKRIKDSKVTNADVLGRFSNKPEIQQALYLMDNIDKPEFKEGVKKVQGQGDTGRQLAPLTLTGSQPESSQNLNIGFMGGKYAPAQQNLNTQMNMAAPGQPVPIPEAPGAPGSVVQQPPPGNPNIQPAMQQRVPSMRQHALQE